jgi:cellulose synthase/poly-beta-1,6-N-acetylglucosamine synthase-like glycosyltransferase
MISLIVLVWVFFALAIHPYVTYPLILLAWSRLAPTATCSASELSDEDKPVISVIIPAYNEEASIAERLRNIQALNWPEDKLEIIVSSDGSEDCTDDIVREMARSDPRIKLLALSRGGQTAAINAGAREATGDIMVITDATTAFGENVLRGLSVYFNDRSVACVVGEVSMVPAGETPVNFAEGLYWRLEAAVRHLEAVVGVGFVGSGACTMFRREKLPNLDPRAAADLDLTLKIIEGGGRIIQLSNVGVYDYMDGDVASQLRSRPRRVRLGLKSIAINKEVLNPLRHAGYAFAIISHKILRWLTGLWMLGMFVTSGVLAFYYMLPLYTVIFAAQAVFYLLALLGLLASKTSLARFRLLSVPLSVTVVAIGFLKGVIDFLKGKHVAIWQPEGSTADKQST